MEWIVIGLVVIAFLNGVPRGIVNIYKKSLAAAVIQSLLERQDFSKRDHGDAARAYIEAAWDSKPDVFNGRFGQRPHKISVAAYALALAAKKLDQQDDEFLNNVLAAECAMFSEIERNRYFYPFTNIDAALIAEAMQVVTPIIEAYEKKHEKLFQQLRSVGMAI